MADKEMGDEREIVDALLRLVAQEMKAGKSRSEIVRMLVDMDLEEGPATQFVEQAWKAVAQPTS
ncbi:MAG: hypothetical protein ACE5JN_16855 [Candidatus Methylomirabilia bacterium]